MEEKISKLVLFADRLFPRLSYEEALQYPQIARLSSESIRQLKDEAGQAFECVSPQVEQALPAAISRFVAPLILLQSDSTNLQCSIRSWLDAQLELLQRLHCDRVEIERSFSVDSSQVLTELELDLSDPHHYGRSVAILTFESGLKLVYKPRDVATEAWYFRTLDQLDEMGAPLPFHALRVLPRGSYGWVEFVSHFRCCSQSELARYYLHAGALLCLLHLFGAVDCHFQNVIAFRERPIVVDAETLFQPELSKSAAKLVTRTGMLPQWRFGPEGQAYDVSGLGCVVPRTTHLQVPKWAHDEVRFEPGVLTPLQNVPFPETAAPRPYLHVDEMVSGFEASYRFISNHREKLRGLIQSARNLPVRYMFRDTLDYYEAVSDGLGSKVGPAARLRELPESLSAFGRLRQHELDALERLDIPRFTLAADSRDLCGLKDCFECSGVTRALDILDSLGEADLDRQTKTLRFAWGLSRIHDSLQ